MNEPNEPGWWAFEGSKLEAVVVWLKDGVEYADYQDEWDDGYYDLEESWWNENYGEEPRICRYDRVPGEVFRSVMLVQYSKQGQQVKTINSFGPHKGEVFLGYLPSHDYYYNTLHAFDLLTGEWTRVYMPWEKRP